MLTKESVKNLNQEELRETLKEKSKELNNLIELIDENTEFTCYGIAAFGVEDSDQEVAGGGSIIGSTLNLARLLNASKDMSEIISASFLLDTGLLDEGADE